MSGILKSCLLLVRLGKPSLSVLELYIRRLLPRTSVEVTLFLFFHVTSNLPAGRQVQAWGGRVEPVYVSFIVEKDGTVGDATVIKGVESSCDEEALRVTKLLNSWQPGKQNGKVVRVRFVLPVKFKL